jgi:large subunit ribosomal protein L21e
MVQRIGTKQRKTRYKFKRTIRERGKISISKYLQQFNSGDKVNLKISSNVEKGRFFPRFYGRTGKISGVKKGECYEVLIVDGNVEKKLYVHPIHLKKI